MLRRISVHLALIFLFAFAQIGLAAHEVSHLGKPDQHSQQDKNQAKHSSGEQCSQCISFAKVANGLATTAFVIPTVHSGQATAAVHTFSIHAEFTPTYAARAPPQSINI